MTTQPLHMTLGQWDATYAGNDSYLSEITLRCLRQGLPLTPAVLSAIEANYYQDFSNQFDLTTL